MSLAPARASGTSTVVDNVISPWMGTEEKISKIMQKLEN